MKILSIYVIFSVFVCTGPGRSGLNAQNQVYGSDLKAASATQVLADEPVEIGSRLEMFLDDYLIDTLAGKASLCLHHPVPREIVVSHDAPWEGSRSGYHSIFRDGSLYKMYYKAWQHEDASKTPTHFIYCCYAESKDGIRWRKPNLGLSEFQGSKDKNIIFIRGVMHGVNADGGHPALFKDDNPGAKSDVLYKAVLIGFPTRYIDRRLSQSMKALPKSEHRLWRSSISERYGTAITEGLLMVSRDGITFKRWNKAFLWPGIDRKGTWNYGQQYIVWSAVETKSSLEGVPNEISLYAVENYWTNTSCDLRRYTLRIDGFVSVNAPMSGDELITKPVIFKGDKLILNFSSSAAGDIRVEIQDINGIPLPGYSLRDCPPIFGDTIERTVRWKNGGNLSSLEGKTIRLRFVLKDADLYSFQFN